VLLEEIAILDEISQANAAVHKADRGLDFFSGRVTRVIDDSTDGPTRKQIRTSLLKGRSLNRFRQPILGGQLEAMTDWSDTLMKCGVPALVALAPEAETLVVAAQDAQKLRVKALQKNRDFRDVGMRKQFIDTVNAARKETHGALAKLPFQNPAFPQDFADSFFYSEAPRDQEETIDEVKTSIEELETQLEERKLLLKKLEDEAASEAQAAQERATQAQEADDLETQGQELLKRAAAMKAKLKKQAGPRRLERRTTGSPQARPRAPRSLAVRQLGAPPRNESHPVPGSTASRSPSPRSSAASSTSWRIRPTTR
jgi:hypothetical protein